MGHDADRAGREPRHHGDANPVGTATKEIDALIDDLAEALDELPRRTCLSMVPLWLAATLSARRRFGLDGISTLPFDPSPRYFALKKSSRSKYRALAAWRHAVLWQDVLNSVPDDDFRAAVTAVYFTAFPDDDPPYSYASSASRAPDVDHFESPTTLKEHAKEGCWHTLRALSDLRDRHAASPERIDIILEALLRCATRRSLTDQLKLEEHDPWQFPT